MERKFRSPLVRGLVGLILGKLIEERPPAVGINSLHRKKTCELIMRTHLLLQNKFHTFFLEREKFQSRAAASRVLFF